MSRLDDVIGDVAYVVDVLIAYKRMVELGDCNSCMRKNCEYIPDLGQFVRYNCPFYEKRSEQDGE